MVYPQRRTRRRVHAGRRERRVLDGHPSRVRTGLGVAGHYITLDLAERRWRRIKRAALLGVVALSAGTWVAL